MFSLRLHSEISSGTGYNISSEYKEIITMSPKQIRKHIRFHGRVQGVGFRYTACYAAEAAGVTGWVKNERDGTVTMEVQGSEEQIDHVIQTLNQGRYIMIQSMDVKTIPLDESEREFYVKESWWF